MKYLNINKTTDWNSLWEQQQAHFKTTIIDNPFIPHKPFFNQVKYLIYPSEELMYGGQAGGGKSDAMLMSALQYVTDLFMVEDEKGNTRNPYKALIIRRTLNDLELPNAILDRAKQWLLPFENTGELRYRDQKKKFEWSNGATLLFRYLYHDSHLDQYQGAELDFVGFDELTQFTEKQYTYLYSRLREPSDSNIPIRMRVASNPGGRGHEWVKKKFIDDDSDFPFIPSAYTDNKYINKEDYGNRLDKLDELTRQQLKYGNWDVRLSSGLLMDLDTYMSRYISYNEFKDWKPVYTTIGIDPASTGTDHFSMACLSYFDVGKIVLVDLYSTTSSKPEFALKDFIKRNKQFMPRVVNFEREQGSSPHYALQYWQNLLSDLMVEYGFYVTDTNASSTGSKYNRAYPVAYHIRQGTLLINKDIPLVYEGGGEAYSPVREFGNQLVYLHPDKEVMKEYSSPDESDSVSYAFEKLQASISGLRLD